MDATPRRVVAVLGTLDTKGREVAYLADAVRRQGQVPWLIDIGLRGTPSVAADVGRDEVARAAGTSMAALEAEERTEAMRAMGRGAAALLAALHRRGQLAGVVAVGGGKGTWIATDAMRALPLGVPKVMVSTGVGRDMRPLIGSRDITLMPSIADIAGLNRITRPILAQAAGAVCGMTAATVEPSPSTRPTIALTMFGVTTPCVLRAQELLEEDGYETIVFHANGMGGAALEDLIEEGLIGAVLDITTTELADELVGGLCSAGPHRLEAAGRRGLPQVIAPGALDAVNFGPPETIPAPYEGRRFVRHTPVVTLMRTTAEENSALGAIMAGKINAARGPVRVVIPAGGFSAYDGPGEAFHDPAADRAFIAGLHGALDRRVAVAVRPEHINDGAFAEALVAALEDLLARTAPAVAGVPPATEEGEEVS